MYSGPVETIPLIPLLSSGSEEDCLFVPRPIEDATLLGLWHGSVLPSLKSSPEEWHGLNAAHLFRQGPTEQESWPVILISIDKDEQEIRIALTQKLSQFFDEELRCSIRISFEQSIVHRSGASYLPPICEARNTAFQPYPRSGASIGIQGRLDYTATLGGFLLIDGRPHILTVDHIIPSELAEQKSISITHPSEQEGQNRPPWIAIEIFLETLQKCCNACFELWKEHNEQTDFYKPIDIEKIQCPTATEFKKLKDGLFREFPVETLGTITCRSETRSRPSLEANMQYEVEMDWALVSVDAWPFSIEWHIRNFLKDVHFSSVVPGAHIKSTGRTSGEQTGQVNTARSVVRHTTRFTQEHSVIKDPQSTLSDWISGGIGVDGDSGSWLIDRDSGALYWAVWGRDRIKTNPICLFSPITDVVADIKERNGAVTVVLPSDEPIAPLASKARRKESFSIPTSFVSRRMSEGGVCQNTFSSMVISKG
jgi:hypothetical protein